MEKTEFKVGQRVMMVGTVKEITSLNNISLMDWDKNPNGGSIFPYTEPFREREMMVWDTNEENAQEITIVSNINGKWQSKASIGYGVAHNWLHAKEIEEPKTEEKLTLDEVIKRLKELIKELE